MFSYGKAEIFEENPVNLVEMFGQDCGKPRGNCGKLCFIPMIDCQYIYMIGNISIIKDIY